jgi:predicted ATPase
MSKATDYLWSFLRPALGSIGAAAVMGNIQSESAFIPTNLQNSYEKKLGFGDAEYTAAVDSGAYSAYNFAHDSAGYGLAQWTHWSRKQNLYNYLKQNGLSIGSLEGQAAFMLWELGQYGLTKKLQAETDLWQATALVLRQYEKPANQTDANVTSRAKLAQQILNLYDAKPDPVPGVPKADLRSQIEALYLIQDQIQSIIDHLKEV